MGARSSRITTNRWDRYLFGKWARRKGPFETREGVPLELCLYAVDEGNNDIHPLLESPLYTAMYVDVVGDVKGFNVYLFCSPGVCRKYLFAVVQRCDLFMVLRDMQTAHRFRWAV